MINPIETEQRRQLNHMRKMAGGLLLAMLVLLLAAKFIESHFEIEWLSYVHAFTEAALVGGLADWFAVTALFRHPLGLKIPHTAIIPNKKDSIGRGIGKFVENNFLDHEMLSAKIRSFDAVSKAEEWLAEPDNSMLVAEKITMFIPEFLHGMDDENVNKFIRNNINATVGRVDLAKVGADVMATLVQNDKDHEVFNELLRLIRVMVDENKPALKKAIADESPWLLKGIMQNQVFDRIMVKVNRTFQDVAMNENHPLRAKFHQEVRLFIHRLKTDPDLQAAANKLKDELVKNDAVQLYMSNIWSDIKKMILEDAKSPKSKIKQRLFRAVYGLSNSLLQEKEVREKVNNYIYQAATNIVSSNRHAISNIITDTIQRWDRVTMVEKLENQVGKDLQYIRISGTLVGGCIGLLLHIVAQLIKLS